MLCSISIKDINEALPVALPLLRHFGKKHTAASLANERPTVEFPGLWITEYVNPERCVLFDPVRDCNPFFHYLESLWIIGGRRDVKTLAHVLPRMLDYSDDGEIFHGAYGYRLRHWNSYMDQIGVSLSILKEKPTTRQVVMSIWDPMRDLGVHTKDLPCNDLVMLKIREGKLNMTVSNRSNDAIFGCYGTNVVQFSMLLMYMAAKLDLPVGTYTQVSDSFHVYEDNPYWNYFKEKQTAGEWVDRPGSRYEELNIESSNIFADGNIAKVDGDLVQFFRWAEESIIGDNPIPDFAHTIAVRTATLLWNGLWHYRHQKFQQANIELSWIDADDWREAAQAWLERRMDKKIGGAA